MSRIYTLAFAFIKVVLDGVSRLRLPYILGLLGIVLALNSPSDFSLQRIDDRLAVLSSYLFREPREASGIAIISVPKEEIDIWQTDIHSSGKLAALLSNILSSGDSTVGLILQRPIDVGAGAADILIEGFVNQSNDELSRQKAKILVDRKFLLSDYLRNERIVVGVENAFFSGQKPLLQKRLLFDRIPAAITQIFLPPSCH